MLEILLTIIVAVAIGMAVIAIVFVLGLRTKSPLVLRPLFTLGRRFFNPLQLKTAGQPGAYASIIRCRGRRTGRLYETPVGAVEADEGFLIALPYGTRSQWLRNVLAAGQAVLVTEGRTVAVDRPELVPMALVSPNFSATDQRLFRLMATTECLRLRPADSSADARPFESAAA